MKAFRVFFFVGMSALGSFSYSQESTFMGPIEWASSQVNYRIEADAPAGSDSQLVAAVQARRPMNFVQAANVVVVRILADDTKGLKHQRWFVRLSDGHEVFAVYNIDISERVPLQIGQQMGLGGQFLWTNEGPLIHWLHQDPQGHRPDGYVDLNGHRYGQVH